MVTSLVLGSPAFRAAPWRYTIRWMLLMQPPQWIAGMCRVVSVMVDLLPYAFMCWCDFMRGPVEM